MIFDMLNNKKLQPVVTELLVRGRKLNISFVFISKSFFATHYFIIKIPDQLTLWFFTKECTAKPYSFLVNDTILTLDNLLRFRQNLFERI